ncbi:polysaccharide lyase family 7 protein [Christiangramia portivictoriae]|uniref:polysaccharide lyase family 7 protein n=1 Tax=Christiangramia portivictoriae TaxID=326069 RepID=UPI00042657CF|nr:polysaccharide lyase family 7 protein [Christiangramia portivictoriae]
MIKFLGVYTRKICLFGIAAGTAWTFTQCKAPAVSSNVDDSISNTADNFKLSKIDLSHWKLTIPEGEGKGGAISVEPPEILNYAENETLKPFMYNDSTSGALVFYAYPSNATTANTKYSRSELREQMEPGNDDVNWTFKDGGNLKARIAMEDVSRDKNGKYHKVIILQIHGRLTDEQKAEIGQKDNNAPPILKIYWDKGKIRVKTKELKFLETQPKGLLYDEAWGDDEGFSFKEEVGFKKFDLEVVVSEGKMLVSLNDNEFKVYENIHMQKWGVFENYFKAGNYLQTRDEGAFAKVKFYELNVTH